MPVQLAACRVLLLCLVLVMTASAQASDIESVTVTARKRAEKLMQVPLCVTVINGARAARKNLNNLQDILPLVPEAQTRTGTTNNNRTLFVRGIGTISTSPGVEPSISTVIDGVVLARSGQAMIDLVGLSQLEVLGGPQGTLFGKNASAGVVNITTAQPTPQTHAWAEADYYGGAGNEYRLTGGATGTLAPAITANIAALSDGFDGNILNSYSGKEVNSYQRDGARGNLRYEPSDDFKATLALDYMKSRDTVPNGVFTASGQQGYPGSTVVPNAGLARVLAGQGIVPGQNNTTIRNNASGYENDDNGGIALTLNQALADYTLTSISAWRIWNTGHGQDFDQTSAPPKGEPQLDDTGTLGFNQWSQEIRLASPKGGLVDFVLGGYFLKTIEDETYNRSYAPARDPYKVTVRGTNAYGTESDDEALFGEANINITPSFRLIAGLRVMHDGLSFHSDRVSSATYVVTGIRPSFAATGATNHIDYSDRLGWQYDITPAMNAYFTYARGYQGPAYNVFFNMAAADTSVLKPETNNSFEAGLKAILDHGLVQADIAAFCENFANYQANFSDLVAGAVAVRLINAGSVSSRGVQAGVTAEPAAGLRIGVSAIYDDAHIDQFNCPPQASASCNVNGEPLPFAPRFKLAANAGYTARVADGLNLVADTDYIWQSRTQYQLTETPDTAQAAYGIWNASLSLVNAPQGWRLTGLIKNITDQHYSSFLAYGGLGGVVRFVPRDVGRYAGLAIRKEF